MDALFAFTASTSAHPDDAGHCPDCGYETELPGEICLACLTEAAEFEAGQQAAVVLAVAA
jgi:uncharacterized OB-fold protein